MVWNTGSNSARLLGLRPILREVSRKIWVGWRSRNSLFCALPWTMRSRRCSSSGERISLCRRPGKARASSRWVSRGTQIPAGWIFSHASNAIRAWSAHRVDNQPHRALTGRWSGTPSMPGPAATESGIGPPGPNAGRRPQQNRTNRQLTKSTHPPGRCSSPPPTPPSASSSPSPRRSSSACPADAVPSRGRPSSPRASPPPP
jgi:hypothetical protein